MGRKFLATATAALSAGNNTVIAAPTADSAGQREHYIRKLTMQRTGTDPVTVIVKNGSGRELEQRWVLNDAVPALYLMFDDETEIGVGGGEPLVINASAAGASMRVEYRTGSASAWPA